jgi:hypothetical protein
MPTRIPTGVTFPAGGSAGRGAATDFANRYNAFLQQQNAPAAPIAPGGGTSAPSLPDYSQIEDIIQSINATNQQAQTNALNQRIPGGPALEQQSSQYIQNLFGDANDPNRRYGELDVPAASAAVASGTVGSPFAGITGLQLTENERIRRGQLAEGNLSAALGRNPAAPIADTQQMYQSLQQQMYQAEQNRLARDLQERIANAQMANAALRQRNADRSSRYGPSLPTDYDRTGGGAASGGGHKPKIPPGPTPPVPPTPRPGPGMLPNIGELDNWYDLTPQQQAEFNAAFGQNPYFGMPDYMNPYSGDDAPLPPLPNLTYDPDVEDFYNYT